MTYNYWYGMGSDLFLKTLRNSTMIYNFKTKIIMQQFNVQISSTFEWGEVSVRKVQALLNDVASNIQRLCLYLYHSLPGL